MSRKIATVMMTKKEKKMTDITNVYCINEDALDRYTADFARRLSEIYSGHSFSATKYGFVSIVGALGRGFWDFEQTDYVGLQRSISMMLDDENIEEIILFIDSPGGIASGLFSFCEYLKKSEKPIHAFINGMACSAAYAIACACTDITIEPDAETGCCGAIGHVYKRDEAYMKSKLGIIEKVFRSHNAPRKCINPIDDEQEAKEYQTLIDECGDNYLSFVASARGIDIKTASKSFGEGRVVTAQYALDNGMVDRIATWADFAGELIGSNNSSLSAEEESEGADMDITKMSAEERKEAFEALIAAEPELLSPTKEKAAKDEQARITKLMALKNGNGSYDKIVDEAISSGKDETETKLALFDFLQIHPNSSKPEEKAEKNPVLQAFVDADQRVNPARGNKTAAEAEEESVMAEVANYMKNR